MWDLLLRALRHPIDYCGSLSKETLTLLEHIDEGNSTHSFIFRPANEHLSWKAGQHGVFTIPGKKIVGKNWRAFSVASCHAEGVVRITTIISAQPSDFKQQLLNLNVGDTIAMRGPFGEFHTSHQATQLVGIAGGVGITPFRSLAYEIVHDVQKDVSLHLIYAGKNTYFAFKNELERFAQHPNVTIEFVNTPDEVNAALDAAVEKYKNSATYFISGSPGMIGAIKSRLQRANIKNIVNDPFKGY